MKFYLSNSIEYVSFDIFDTLVHRRLAAPVDLFFAIRNKLCDSNFALYHAPLLGEFPTLRIKAEKQAREVRKKAHADEGEILLHEIYHEFQQITNAEDKEIQILVNTEMELETKLLYSSPQGRILYEHAKKSGKKIIYVSDMYLPADFIQSMMQGLGFNDCTENTLFVSGEVRKSKCSGALFDHVSTALKIQHKTWMHVGDNIHSDVKRAKERGIETFHADWSAIKNVAQKCNRMNDHLVSSIIQTLSASHFTASGEISNPFVRQGYFVFGPLIFGFYLWLLKELTEYKPDKIIFFARDSQLILKIHHFLIQHQAVEMSVPCEYAYASRMALYKIGFTDLDLDKLSNLTAGKTSGTVEEIFKIIGVDINQHTSIMNEVDLTPKARVNESNREKFKTLMGKLYDTLLITNSEQRKQFQSYFLKMIPDSARVALIDIGWKGNIQSFFLRTLGDKWSANDYQGLYLGTIDSVKNNSGPYTKLKGWLIDEGIPKSKQDLLTRGGIELLEFALTADHGSTQAYTTLKNGEVAPVLEIKSREEDDYEHKAMQLQSGILMFVKDHMHLLTTFPLASLQSNLWQKSFLKLVKKPTATQVRIFSNLTHSDSVGVNSTRMPLAEKIPLLDCIIKRKKYTNGRNKAFWKSGFRRLNSPNYRFNEIIKFFIK
jgi:predicted HAD superfamily hydrolase